MGFRLLLACSLLLIAAVPSAHHSQYLFTWAMETRDPADTMPAASTMGDDVLAVFDVSPDASPFGKLVGFLSTGSKAKMAHHTNYVLPSDNVLYANDWMGNSTFVFDLNDATHPRIERRFASIGKYSYPHAFAYLSNGNTLAAFQYAGGFNKGPGGLIEFDSRGRVVRASSAADPSLDPNIRPYSMAVSQKLDRVVTSSADMMGAQESHVAQVWRLSDLKLLKTMVLPKPAVWYVDTAADSSEPRTLGDGTTVVVPTFNCGLFLVKDLASNNPTLRHVYDLGYRTCEVPVVAGNYLVLAAQSGHALVSLDMRDPAHPHEVSRLLLAGDEYPHWLAIEPNENRIAITGRGALATHVRFATIDPDTGTLALDPESIDMKRAWPDGWNGAAVPHGSVFSNN